MEIIVIGGIFFGVVVAGAALATTLVTSAVRADNRYLDREAQQSTGAIAEPVWVEPRRAAA